MVRVASIAYWLLALTIAALMFPIALLLWTVTTPWDRRRAILHRFTNLWASIYVWVNPVWSVRVEGREHIVPGRAYVMVSNHLSLVDVFVLHRLSCHFKWVSKVENFRLPFIGWNMTLNGYIRLRRGERESVLKMFAQCRAALARGSSILMVPEGTRSRDGQLRAFKPGAFELAKQARVPILPIAVQGTFEALEPKTLGIAPARMQVTVLPEVPPFEVEQLSVEALSERVRGQIAEHVH